MIPVLASVNFFKYTIIGYLEKDLGHDFCRYAEWSFKNKTIFDSTSFVAVLCPATVVYGYFVSPKQVPMGAYNIYN